MSDKSYLTIEDVISLPRLSHPALSEDGRQVAWVVLEPDWDKNEYRRYVHIHDVSTGITTVVAGGQRQSLAPAWSNDGCLAWLGPVGDGHDRINQLFVFHQGRATQVTHSKGGVVDFRWDLRGRGIYYLAPDRAKKESLKRRNEQYGEFEYVDVDCTPHCLFYLDLDRTTALSLSKRQGPGDLNNHGKDDPNPPRQVAGGQGCHILRFEVSPDGARVVYSAAPSPSPDDWDRAGLYLLDVGSGSMELLDVKGPIHEFGPVLFSPDGTRICYTRPVNEGKWFNVKTLEIRDLENGRTCQPLSRLDECIYPVRWTSQGLVFTWQQRTDWYVSRLDRDGHVSGLVASPGMVTREAAVSADGKHLATVTATRDQPFEVYLDGRRITDQARHYAGRTLSEKETISWKSRDGTLVEGVFITPRDFDRHRRHPLLVVVHGGPSSAALAVPTSNPYYPYEQFVEKGFIILDVNYRGSSGYGDAFRKLNFRNLGIGDYEDVISGVDMLVDNGLADRDRVGIMGWSQGGYISAMCTTYSNRFRAVSAGAGISNWSTYYCSTDIHNFTRHYLGDTPWNDPEIYSRTSPMTYIKNACTPTLIQHGDRDTRVPTPNALELYQGLRDMGVEVKLVLFRGMGHGAEKPGLHRAIMHQNLSWFCHHLLGHDLDGFWLEVHKNQEP